MALDALRSVEIDFTEAAFAVENGSHTWVDVAAIDATFVREQQVHAKKRHLQRLTEHAGQVLGRRSGSLAYQVDLAGDGTALDTGATPSDDSIQQALERCLGGTYSAAGSTVASSANTHTITVQAGHGARFSPGTAILVAGTGDDGENEISWIESISTDTLTLAVDLSNTPSADAAVYNGYTAYIDPSATSTVQARMTGDDSDDVWLGLGMAGTVEFASLLQVDDTAKLVFNWFISRWEEESNSLSVGTYDGASPLGTSEELEVHFQTHGTTTRNLISVSALEASPGVTWTPTMARGNGDREHVDRIVMTKAKPTASFTADVDGAFLTAFRAGTEKMLMIAFGRTPGSSWAIVVPRAIISALPVKGAHFEQIATQVALQALENNCGAAASAIELSPIFITRL